MAETNLYEFSDLLYCAQSIGYDWNQAHKIMVKDEIPPMYEAKKREFYIGECTAQQNYYGYSEDTLMILQAFFKQECIREFTIV